MSEPARIDPPLVQDGDAPAPAAERHLEVVRDAPDPVEPPEPTPGRAAAIGYVVAFVVSAVSIAAGGTAAGMEPGAAVGLGIFVGIWGGGGFGFMLGATTYLSLHGSQRPHRPPRPPAATP